MICVSVTEPNLVDAVKVANKSGCDLVEIRLDYLKKSYDLSLLKKIKKPVIAACMPVWEGGRYKGTEEERVSTLFSILDFCDYVCLELRTKNELRNKLIKEAKKKKVKIILSYHDFTTTPSKKEITDMLRLQEIAGADIAKIAYKANSYGDALKVMSVLAEKETKTPVIAISMGEHGKITRVLGPVLGSYLTYASPSKGKESAPGQLTVEEMKTIQKILEKKK